MFGFIVDIIIVLIVLFGLILGISKGFIKTVAKPVKFVLALVIAFSFCANASVTFVEPLVREPLSNQIVNYIEEKSTELTPDNLDEELPTVLKIAATVFDIDIENLSDETTPDEIVAEIVDKLISPAIHLISTVISFFILYILASIVFSILLSIFNAVFDGGVLGLINKILGAVFSTALAIIIAWVATLIFTYVLNLPVMADKVWVQEFDGGFIFEFFNKFNPIDLVLSF